MSKYPSLFDGLDNKWQEEWKDMPEFKMNHIKPVRVIKINFLTEEAIVEFAKLIGQNISGYENYWFPKLNFKTDGGVCTDEP
jgi:hypothetical protein